MADMIAVLNTIRDNASQTYQDRIPEATRTNLESIQEAILNGDNVQVANEFMTTLLNKIVKSVVHTKRFANPLKALKSGTKPIGDTIEEIYANFIKANVADQTGAKLLERNLPDTKVAYHRMNYSTQYPITIDRKRLAKAFTSYDNLNAYVNSIINQLYNSAELDEFVNMKQLIKTALTCGAVKEVEVADPTESEANAKAFIKAVKLVSEDMVFPSDRWNGYLTAQTKDTKPIITFSRKDEQVLILDSATNVSVNVDVLASLFNMSVAEFNDTKKIIIDAFPDPDIYGFLCDKEFFQVFDDFYGITEFFNGQGVYTNYWLNVDQTMSFSPLVNAVCFKKKSGKVITNLMGTTWYFNENCVKHTYDINMNFISNSQEYDNICFEVGAIVYQNTIVDEPIFDGAYQDDTGWLNEAYRTIEITGGANVTDKNVIAWLQANATLVE